MPTVSIITTTYKHKDFIGKAIESIINQTYTDWELLIGDDSPNDKTWKIIESYTKKYPEKIKAWHHKINLGIVDNMNFLLSKVSKNSKFIAILEGDDLYTPKNLEIKVNIFNKFPDLGLVYNNLSFIDKNGKIIKKNYFNDVDYVIKNDKLNIENFLMGDKFYTTYSSLMVKKEVFDEIKLTNFGDKTFTASDWIFFCETANKFKIYGEEKILTFYRRHSGNLSGNRAKMSEDLVSSIEYLTKKYKTKKNYYKIYYIKTYNSYLKGERINTIKNGIISFRYSLTKSFIDRIGMIFLSLMPKKINEIVYNHVRKF